MKIRYALLLCSLFAAASPLTGFGESIFRPFVTADGRSLTAAIKDYNERTKKIQIEREDGQELWILPTVLSEPDREYILQWIAVQQFMSPTKFKIKGDSDKDKNKNITHIAYAITLENRTDFPLKGLKIEYRSFIFKQGYEGNTDSNRVGGGQLHIAEIPVGKKFSRNVASVHLTAEFRTVWDQDSSGTASSSQQKTSQEYLKGFWVKVYGPEIDGKPSIREWCNPPDTSESFAWQEATPDSHQKSASAGKPTPEKEVDPAKEIDQLIQDYDKSPSTRGAKDIAYAYLWRLKPPNILLGLEWYKKAAENNDVGACRSLSLVYSGFYGHTEYYSLEKTLKYGEKVLSRKPGCHTAPQALAKAYALDNQFDKAVKYQSQAIDAYIKNTKGKPSHEHLSTMEAALELFKNKKTR